MSLVAWLPAVPGVILLVLAQCAVGASLPVMGVLVGAKLAGRPDQARQQLRLEILGSPLAHAVTLGTATLVQFVSIQVAVALLAALCVVQAVLLKVAPGMPQKATVPPAKALRVLARRPGTAAAWIGGVLAFGPIAYAYTLAVLRADELDMPPLALVATISCLGFLASFTAWRLLRARVVADARGVAILGAGIMVVAVLLAVIPSSGLAGGLLAFAAISGLEFGVFGVNSLFQTWLGDRVRGETQTDRVQKRLVYVTTRSLAMFVFAGLEVFPIEAVQAIAPIVVVVAVVIVPFLISLRRVERHDDVQLETGERTGRLRVAFHLATSAHQTVVAATLPGMTRAYSVMPGDLIRVYLVREQVVDTVITLRVYAQVLPGGRGTSMFPGAVIADGRLTVLPPGLRAVHDTMLERDVVDPDVLRAFEDEHFYGTGQVRRLDIDVELADPARVRVAPRRVKQAGDEKVAQLRAALGALRGRFGHDVEVSAGRGVDGLHVYIGCDLPPEEVRRLADDLPKLGYEVKVRDVNDVAVIPAQ